MLTNLIVTIVAFIWSVAAIWGYIKERNCTWGLSMIVPLIIGGLELDYCQGAVYYLLWIPVVLSAGGFIIAVLDVLGVWDSFKWLLK